MWRGEREAEEVCEEERSHLHLLLEVARPISNAPWVPQPHEGLIEAVRSTGAKRGRAAGA